MSRKLRAHGPLGRSLIVVAAFASTLGTWRASGASEERGGIAYVREPLLEQMSERRVVLASPDSRNLYVLGGGYVSGQVALFRRNRAGGLNFRSCLGRDVTGFDCGPLRANWRVGEVAFSPDGRNVYAAARPNDPALVVLARNPQSGRLSELAGAAGCIQRRARKQPEVPPCAEVPAAWFTPTDVRVTADGRTVVVLSWTANEGQGIFLFSRDPSNGELTFLSCFVTVESRPARRIPKGRRGFHRSSRPRMAVPWWLSAKARRTPRGSPCSSSTLRLERSPRGSASRE